ncbi:MAG: AAA family ATPase [Planctomycetia bacterium]|nr:AAA family ATPase [Planctomycetia bacterium]
MLLRLHVKGFKNLRDVDVRFGPLTCFVGTNGVGKSNLFDAIQFLRLLADHEIQHAAESIRSPASGMFGPLDLFWAGDPAGRIELEADMLVPTTVVDDFGRPAHASITLLRYAVGFRYAEAPKPRVELVHEELRHIAVGDAARAIGFPHTVAFRKSAVAGRRSGGAFISTRTTLDQGRSSGSRRGAGRRRPARGSPGAGGLLDTGSSSDSAMESGPLDYVAGEGIVAPTQIVLHQDGGSRGRPVPPGSSPRTVLGGTTAAEYPTVLAARREMASWRSLHLEPSSLRAPDPFGSEDHVSERGHHIAATLARMTPDTKCAPRIFAEAASRLAGVVPEVAELRVRRDEVLRQHVLEARLHGSVPWMGPRALSDGTLRFLALVTMQMDPEAGRVLCMEEPENGIHPDRIPAMVRLLRDYAVDPELAIGADNPLRQVIVNSHSPELLKQLDVPEILFVEAVDGPDGRWAEVGPIAATGNWRGEAGSIPLSRLEAVLGGAPMSAALRDRQLTLGGGTSW